MPKIRIHPKNCIDTDECFMSLHNCSEHATCTNSQGNFSCQCPETFFGSGSLEDPCVDINECQDNQHNCQGLSNCVNMLNGYSCQCKEGYRLEGIVESFLLLHYDS